MRLAITVVLILTTVEVGLAQRGPTLRQLAIAKKGGTYELSSGCGYGGSPLGSIVKWADVAVEAILLNKQTYTMPGDRDIFTEYAVAPKQVIFQRSDPTSVQAMPSTSMIFKTRGGTVLFEGYPFTVNVTSGSARGGRRAHELNAGDHVVLFGRYDKSDGKWTFGSNLFFQVSGNVLLNWLPILENVPRVEPNMLIAEFAQRVRELAVNR